MATVLSSLVGAKEPNDLRESLPRLFCQKYYSTRLPIRQRLSQRLHRTPKKQIKVSQIPQGTAATGAAAGMSQVLCTCKRCTGDDPFHSQGRWVSSTTRSRHRRQTRPSVVHSAIEADTTEEKVARSVLSEAQTIKRHPKPLHTHTPHYETANSGKLASHHKGHYIAPEKLKLTTAAGSDEPSALSVAISVQLLVVWLYLYAGISRNAANIVLKVVRLILNDALVRLSATPPSPAKIPGDIRTAIKKLAITPEMHRRLCCSRCFTLYPLDTEQTTCTWREVSGAQECGQSLWRLRWGVADAPRRAPTCLYTYQSMRSWLEFMLSLPSFEKLVDSPLLEQPVRNSICNDVWYSRMWQELGDYTRHSGNLVFAFYIDWFNPLTNKIAGKKISMGVIILACLNLPPDFRYKSEYLFIAGITPGPREPSMITINNILEPLVNELQQLNEGIIIKTANFHEGRRIRVRVIPIIADLVALRKVTGFAAHSATLFCSYCKLTRNEINSSKPQEWATRVHSEVLKASEEWVNARTLKRRKLLVKKNGVRFSLLHRLQYRDSVKHNVIGIMHNWLEGVLQHHLRSRWGLDSSVTVKVTKEQSTIQSQQSRVIDDGNDDNEWSEELSDWEVELQELRKDGELHDDAPTHPYRQSQRASGVRHVRADLRTRDNHDADPNYIPMSENGSDQMLSDDSEAFPPHPKFSPEKILTYPTFNETGVLDIRAAISDVFLPT